MRNRLREICGLGQQPLPAIYSEFDVDQTVESKCSLCFFPLFYKMGKCIMIEFVTTISALVAAVSVGGIVVTLFLVAIGKVG